MRAVVIYESMYGNTHLVAEAIAEGFTDLDEVVVVPVWAARPPVLVGSDLLVVGGPTHGHSLSRPSTRQAAADALAKPSGADLHLEPDATGDGLREWFHHLGHEAAGATAAAFDTRVAMPPALSGRASRGIAKRLRQHGFTLVTEPESFLVDRHNHLLPGELDRARAWGRELADALVAAR
jgi:hypothetical protein